MFCEEMGEEFAKVEEVRPVTSGHTLLVKVVSSKNVLNKSGRPTLNPREEGQGRQMNTPSRLAECIVGDDTAVIVFVARGDQVDMMKPGETVILRNAKVDMYRGSMRLSVDRWGRIEPTGAASFEAKEDNNLSLIEFEMITVVDG